MTTLNIPTIQKKRCVENQYKPNSFRVIGDLIVPDTQRKYDCPEQTPDHAIQEYAKTLALPSWTTNSHKEPARNVRDTRRCSVGFLRRNVASVNEPVCYVPTETSEKHWWPSGTPKSETSPGKRTLDSTMRASYIWEAGKTPAPPCRSQATRREPALGVVPVNVLMARDGRQQFHTERISYEHQYNPRDEKNYPPRGKRHGAIVLRPLPEHEAKRLIASQNFRADHPVRSAGSTLPPTPPDSADKLPQYQGFSKKVRVHFTPEPSSVPGEFLPSGLTTVQPPPLEVSLKQEILSQSQTASQGDGPSKVESVSVASPGVGSGGGKSSTSFPLARTNGRELGKVSDGACDQFGRLGHLGRGCEVQRSGVGNGRSEVAPQNNLGVRIRHL